MALQDNPSHRIPRERALAMTVEQAVERLDRRSEPRLIVLDADGVTLRGLICFNRSSSGFCVR